MKLALGLETYPPWNCLDEWGDYFTHGGQKWSWASFTDSLRRYLMFELVEIEKPACGGRRLYARKRNFSGSGTSARLLTGNSPVSIPLSLVESASFSSLR